MQWLLYQHDVCIKYTICGCTSHKSGLHAVLFRPELVDWTENPFAGDGSCGGDDDVWGLGDGTYDVRFSMMTPNEFHAFFDCLTYNS